MGHPLEKQFFVAFLCLSMATTIPATRKEELERAAELAVERAAERAAERAVEKALEAGNTTSTTVTVKESYSNARKTAEEQAAPGSESTRQNKKETSIFETRDTDDSSDYESSFNGTDYNDNSEPRDYDDEESSEYGDYNESKGYNNYNDSRGYSDYNDSRGYSDENDSRGYSDSQDSKDFHEFKESKNVGDYNDSKEFGDFDHSKKHIGYNTPRGFGNYNIDSRGYSDSKNLRDPRGYNQSKSSNDFGEKNYTGSKEYRGSNNNSQGYKDSKSLNNYGDSKGYEVKEDYSSSLNQTDYKKLNSSMSSTEPEIILPFEDFDWSSNDSNLRHGFGSKLLGFGKKLRSSALSEDVSFYSAETEFSKKRNTKKEDEEEDGVGKDDSWKSYSDWKKDFKSYEDETFLKDDETFLKGYDEPFTKDFWDANDKDSPPKSSRPFWDDKDDISSSETRKENKTEYGTKTNPQEKGGTLSSTQKYSKQPFSTEYDFTTFTKSWQPENKNPRPVYKSYTRRSSRDKASALEIIPPYHKRLSRNKVLRRETTSTPERIITSTVEPETQTTDRTFRVYNNMLKETSNERYLDPSEGGYKEGSYHRFENKSNQPEDISYEKFKESFNVRSKERLADETKEKYKQKSSDKSNESFSDEFWKEYKEKSFEKSTVQSSERTPGESGEEYKEKSHERPQEGSKNRPGHKSKEGFSDESREKSTGGSNEKYKDRSAEKSNVQFSDQLREYNENSYAKYKERPKERRTEGITESSNLKDVVNEKEENVSREVKTVSYKQEAQPLNIYKQTPTDVKESRQPYKTYKVPINIRVPVPVSLSFPVHSPTPVQHQENSQEVKEDQENLKGNHQGEHQGSSHVQFLQNLFDSLNMPLLYPYIPRTKLKVQKPIVKQVLDPHEAPKLYSAQKRLPVQKQHQQVAIDDRLPTLVKMGVPGPFPIANDNLQLEKPYSVPVKVHVQNPYTINLDKSIPLALKERIPFIIHVPLKPKENEGWSEARHSKKYENVPEESQTWIKRLSWA